MPCGLYIEDGFLKMKTRAHSRTSGEVALTDLVTSISGSFFSSQGGSLMGTDGSGFLGLKTQSAVPATPASGVSLYSLANNQLAWRGVDTFTRTLGGTLTGNHTYLLPNADGTLALVSDLTSGYLPLSGGTLTGLLKTPKLIVNSAVDDGVNQLQVTGSTATTGLLLTGTAGNGKVTFPTQSSAPSTPASGFSLYANATNALSWKGANGFVRVFDGTSNTADRTYTLPDASGTFGLLGSTQTWTGTNTFIPPTSVLSTGSVNLENFYPTVNQSGTAGYIARRTSVYEQTTGSGTKLLLDLGTNSAANGTGTHTSKFNIANDGIVTTNGYLIINQPSTSPALIVQGGTNPGIQVNNSGLNTKVQSVNTAGYGAMGTESNHPFVFLSNNIERGRVYPTGRFFFGSSPTDDGVSTLNVNGIIKSTQYRLSTLNTAPSSASDTGTLGEIRVTATYIYVCTATNTWVRSALTTW